MHGNGNTSKIMRKHPQNGNTKPAHTGKMWQRTDKRAANSQY